MAPSNWMPSRLDISSVELIEARDSTKNQKPSLTPTARGRTGGGPRGRCLRCAHGLGLGRYVRRRSARPTTVVWAPLEKEDAEALRVANAWPPAELTVALHQ